MANASFGDLVSRTLDSVVNGVSQQPPTVRLASQCEEQINLHSRVSEGAARRPPSEYVSTLHTASLPSKGYKAHIRYRDADIQHLVLIEDDDIRVWNILTGVEATVHGLAVLGYLSETTGARVDKTTEANQATANDMPLLPAADVTSGSWFASAQQFAGIELKIGTAGAGTYTLAWEYYTTAATWSSLTVTDPSTHFKNTAGTYHLTFTPPTDWGKGTFDSIEGYWIRARYVSGTVTTNPLGTRAYINAKPYLSIGASSLASDAFAIMSVADYSFIVNKEVTVAMSGIETDDRVPAFMISAQESWGPNVYDWHHKIGSDDYVKTGFTNSTSESGTPWSPGALIESLIEQVYLAANYGNEWTFSNLGTVLYGYQDDLSGGYQIIYPPDFEYSNEVYAFIGAQTQRFSDLPAKAIDGFTTEITGGDGNEGDNYWVEYEGDTGAWIETVAPGQDNTFAARTLPHVLIQTSTGGGVGGEDEFTFGIAAWEDRGAGDTVTAPEPSFIGKTISDVVFHKNRLGLASGESIVLSESGQFFNFWPTTVATLVDSDPIDAAGTNNRVGVVDYAIPFDEKLYLFSSIGGFQNVLRAAGNATVGLTAANAELPEASAFPVSALARPVPIGKAILFAVDRAVSTAIYEYAIADNGPDAEDVTSHIPTYIPANVKQISAAPRENMAVLRSSDELYKLYVYSWFFNGGRKIQASWSTWEFDDSYNIIDASWVDSVLYLTVKRTDGLHLEKLDFSILAEGGLSHRVYLDTLEELTGVYTEADNLTRWTTSTASDPASYGSFRAVLTHASWGDDAGQAIDLDYEAATGDLYTEGDYSDYAAHVGRLSSFTYEFTKPILKIADSAAGAEIAVTQGRLQIGKWKVLTRNSGGFYAEVASEEVNSEEITVAEDPFLYYAPDKIVSAGTVGPTHPRLADEFLFDVGMEAKYAKIEIKGASHLPFTLIGAEWEGRYTTRSQRI